MFCASLFGKVKDRECTAFVKNERGAMVLLSLFLAGFVPLIGLAVMQLYQNNLNYSRSIADSADMSMLQTQIGRILMNSHSCRWALGGPFLYGAGATAFSQTINPAINSQTNIRLFQSNAQTPFIDPADATRNTFGRLTITGIRIRPDSLVPGSTNIYWASLQIDAQRENNLSLQRADLKVSVQLDAANRIVACTGISFLGTDQQPLPVCASDQSLYSNGQQVRCVRTLCPSGQTPTGAYWPDGTRLCAP